MLVATSSTTDAGLLSSPVVRMTSARSSLKTCHKYMKFQEVWISMDFCVIITFHYYVDSGVDTLRSWSCQLRLDVM